MTTARALLWPGGQTRSGVTALAPFSALALSVNRAVKGSPLSAARSAMRAQSCKDARAAGTPMAVRSISVSPASTRPFRTIRTRAPAGGFGHASPRAGVCAGTSRGRSTVKMAPEPGRLSTRMSPPIAWTSFFEMARPSPVPPCRRASPCSACSNSEKMRPSAWERNARPVTSKRRLYGCRAWGRNTHFVSETPPSSVNLIALPTRFIRTCRMRISSPITVLGKSGAANQPISKPLVAGTRPQFDDTLDCAGNLERRGARSIFRLRPSRSRGLRR